MYVCLLFSIIPIRIDLSTVCPLVNQVHFQWTFSELVDYNVIDACHGFRKWLNFEIDYCSSGNTRFRIRNFLFPYHISCAFRKLKQKTELSEKQKLYKKVDLFRSNAVKIDDTNFLAPTPVSYMSRTTDSLRPKFKSHSQINIWELDIKRLSFV